MAKNHVITLRPLINSLKKQMDSAIKEQLSNSWQETLRGLDTNNISNTWRISESLANTSPDIATPGDRISGKLNAFADTLEQIVTTNSDVDRSYFYS
jgi:hypothetical protein